MQSTIQNNWGKALKDFNQQQPNEELKNKKDCIWGKIVNAYKKKIAKWLQPFGSVQVLKSNL